MKTMTNKGKNQQKCIQIFQKCRSRLNNNLHENKFNID